MRIKEQETRLTIQEHDDDDDDDDYDFLRATTLRTKNILPTCCKMY